MHLKIFRERDVEVINDSGCLRLEPVDLSARIKPQISLETEKITIRHHQTVDGTTLIHETPFSSVVLYGCSRTILCVQWELRCSGLADLCVCSPWTSQSARWTSRLLRAEGRRRAARCLGACRAAAAAAAALQERREVRKYRKLQGRGSLKLLHTTDDRKTGEC